MYNFITAFAKEKERYKAWVQVDLSKTVLRVMHATYSKIYLHVTNSNTSTIVRRIDWDDIRGDVVDLSVTLEEYFESIGNKTLKTYTSLASLSYGCVRYADAFQAGYDVQIINRAYSVDNENRETDANDIFMVKEGVSAQEFKNNCLVVINDLLHYVDADSRYIYVTDAMKSCRLSGRNEVGIINFKDVSNIACYPLKEDMIFGESETRNKLGEKFYIKIPTAARNKLLAISLGGYLHFLNDKVFYPISPDMYCFDMRNIEFVDRVLESEEIIDLTSLQLERSGRNNKQLSKAQLYSNPVVLKYATLSQSFLIAFDNPDIIKEMIGIKETALPGLYLYPLQPTLPIVYKKGMLASYRIEIDEDMFAIRTHRGFYNHYLAHTTTKSINPADNRVPHDPRKRSIAYFMKLYTVRVSLADSSI